MTRKTAQPQYVADTKAGKSLSAWVILDKRGKYVAKVLAHFSDGGQCLVNVFDDAAGFQQGKAGGYGYDKLTVALAGLTIAGHILTDHCSTYEAPKKPRSLPCYPADFKTPKGYRLANYGDFSRADGEERMCHEWQNIARAELGESADYGAVNTRAEQMRDAWRATDDCVKGYSNCYRISGLDYLPALGFQIIHAL